MQSDKRLSEGFNLHSGHISQSKHSPTIALIKDIQHGTVHIPKVSFVVPAPGI